MAGMRSNVADLLASHELRSEKVAALEARADGAGSDCTGMCGEGSALRSQLSELTSRLSSIEAIRVSPDISIAGTPVSVTDSPRTRALKLFEALGIPGLAADVLDVRSLAKKIAL